jgi:cephalosporin-C deacetylase
MMKNMIHLDKEPEQFDAFWRHASMELKQMPFGFVQDNSYQTDHVDEVCEFHYFGAKREKVYGFYMKHHDLKRPTILMFHGYGWHKGEPEDFLDWYDLGLNVFSIDIRGQRGLTKDSIHYPEGDQRLMTRGLSHPEHYFLKHVYQDGMQLIDLVKTLPFVDENKVILNGASQGGGIVFALAGLKDVFITFADVPSYSQFRGRIETKNGSVREIADFMNEHHMDKELTIQKLQYFDLVHFAKRVKSPVIASVGLKDDICPAKYFMPAYDRLSVEKKLYEYKDAGHEGGSTVHHKIKLELLKKFLISSDTLPDN